MVARMDVVSRGQGNAAILCYGLMDHEGFAGAERSDYMNDA